MLRGNQRGIIIFYASSFACLVPDIGSQRECFLWAQTHTHTRAPAAHKVAFTVGVLILCG